MSTLVQIELQGPNFIQSAAEISQRVAVKTISRLYIYNLTADAVMGLVGGLYNLRSYLAGDAIVVITTPQILPPDTTALLEQAALVPVQISKPIAPASPGIFGANPFEALWTAAKYNAFNSANNSALFQMQAKDMQQALTLFGQVAAESRKMQTERWKIMQDTQTKIFEITQAVTVNKAKTAEKTFRAMDGYIRS